MRGEKHHHARAGEAGVIALASPLLTLELLSAKPFPVIGSVLNVFKVYSFRQ